MKTLRERRILYLSYWSISDVLTVASVLPSLKAIASLPHVSEIIFCTIERGSATTLHNELPPKVKHIPLRSLNVKWIDKVYDFTIFPRLLSALVEKNKINTIICRSSLAGGMLVDIARRKQIPLTIESFEPHSEYMIDSGVWKRSDLRSRHSRRMEEKLKQYADFLLPVSFNYEKQLISEGIDPKRLRMIPCTVNLKEFSFDPVKRKEIREAYGWTDMVVGIYVGKFGGIYYRDEAFELFQQAFKFFGNRFALIVLTSQVEIGKEIETIIGPAATGRLKVLFAKHHEVAGYLSAADFAFSTIKPGPSRRFCSAIKHGEYWAAGLPIVLEPGIGDDSAIIANEGGGVILTRPRYPEAFESIQELIKPGHESIYPGIHALAMKYRNESIIETTYKDILAS